MPAVAEMDTANKNGAALMPAIVVTGASSGIGRDIARLAAADRCFLLLLGRSPQALDELVAELAAAGAQAAALPIDLLDPHAPDRVESALADRGLYCDVLVNSAGFGVFGAAAKARRQEQLNLVDVNIRALTELTLRFLPAMLARGRGGVLNVGSITGYAAGPNMAAYYASKAYVNSFSAALAAEVAGSGVTVTCLTPGVVRTAFFERCAVGQSRLMKLMPRSNSPDVAEVGWHGFKAGKRLVIPRLIDRISVAISLLLPQSLLTRFVGWLQRPR
jgi:short-subunit dehydrogenase